MKRILVLRGGALGDFIVTLPALSALKARWPETHVELVGNRTAAELGVIDGVLDVAHSQHEARWAALYGSEPLPSPLADWLKTFDCVVSWWPDPERELASKLPARPGQVFVSGTAKPACAPAARHYCETLVALGVEATGFTPRLRFAVGTRQRRSGEAKRVVIHPGSGSPHKTWPLDRWRELARRLVEAGVVLTVVGGETERAVLENFGGGVTTQCGMPLPELARLLDEADVFVGHDTGVSHLAAAAGCPVLALFGPTDPDVWAPQGERVRVIRKGGDLASISVDEVRQELDALTQSHRR